MIFSSTKLRWPRHREERILTISGILGRRFSTRRPPCLWSRPSMFQSLQASGHSFFWRRISPRSCLSCTASMPILDILPGKSGSGTRWYFFSHRFWPHSIWDRSTWSPAWGSSFFLQPRFPGWRRQAWPWRWSRRSRRAPSCSTASSAGTGRPCSIPCSPWEWWRQPVFCAMDCLYMSPIWMCFGIYSMFYRSHRIRNPLSPRYGWSSSRQFPHRSSSEVFCFTWGCSSWRVEFWLTGPGTPSRCSSSSGWRLLYPQMWCGTTILFSFYRLFWFGWPGKTLKRD